MLKFLLLLPVGKLLSFCLIVSLCYSDFNIYSSLWTRILMIIKKIYTSKHPLLPCSWYLRTPAQFLGITSFPFNFMPWSQENKPCYINLISVICILIKWEFTSPAGEIKEHVDCWGMWLMAIFNKAFCFHVVMIHRLPLQTCPACLCFSKFPELPLEVPQRGVTHNC